MGELKIQEFNQSPETFLSLVREKIDLSVENTDEEVRQTIVKVVYEETKNTYMGLQEKENLIKTLFDSLRKLDVLQDYIEDDEVTEIMVNGSDHIFIEKKGVIHEEEKRFVSTTKLHDVIQQIVSSCNRIVNESEPIVDARLPDGSRVNIVLSPPAVNGPIITIRRFPKNKFTLEKLIENESISKEGAEFLKAMVNAGYNCFVSGGTSSGKTTLLNVLLDCIPENERVITIEDSAELQISNIRNLVRLETRNSNSSGCREINMDDLVKTALRMRPDRIVIGEVRGKEVASMLSGFNTGHDGSLSSGHSNSCEDMISRLEAMYLQNGEIPIDAIRRQIASGIDIMIHLERCRDGKRRIMEITELLAGEKNRIEFNRIYKTVIVNGEYRLIKCGKLINTAKLVRSGLDVPHEERKEKS